MIETYKLLPNKYDNRNGLRSGEVTIDIITFRYDYDSIFCK